MKVYKILSYIFFLTLSFYTSKGNNIDINPTKIDVIVEKDSTDKPMLLVPPMPSLKETYRNGYERILDVQKLLIQ